MNFDSLFSSEEKCYEYLWELRYPDGFLCPKCGGNKYWLTQKKLAMCNSCKYQGSVTAGTIFQDTRKPLQSWFRAIWWLVAQKNGVSALGLQRILGLGSYQTAWAWLHRFRRLLVIPGREISQEELKLMKLMWVAINLEPEGGVQGENLW